LDPEQDIDMLGGHENDGWTVIKFRRQLTACEPTYDKEITVKNESFQLFSELKCVKFPYNIAKTLTDMQKFSSLKMQKQLKCDR